MSDPACFQGAPRTPVITLDGPSASGKGTLASRVAAQLGFHYLDSGAFYRLLALAAQQQKLGWDDETALCTLAGAMDVHFQGGTVWLNGSDVSATIRSEAIGMAASAVAKLPRVRRALLDKQRAFAQAPGLVADGRDMGTVVFPEAVLKIFVVCDPVIRAQRRARQLGHPENSVEFATILRDIRRRDEADCNRAAAPLQPAPEAKILDTGPLSIEDAVALIVKWFQNIETTAIITA